MFATSATTKPAIDPEPQTNPLPNPADDPTLQTGVGTHIPLARALYEKLTAFFENLTGWAPTSKQLAAGGSILAVLVILIEMIFLHVSIWIELFIVGTSIWVYFDATKFDLKREKAQSGKFYYRYGTIRLDGVLPLALDRRLSGVSNYAATIR